MSNVWLTPARVCWKLTKGATWGTSVVNLSGALTVTSGEGLGKGLLGQFIGFDDGGTTLVGRAVFTDERGDHIYAAFSAQPIGSGRKATATLTGGTGRFAGIEGTFSFSWEYVLYPESSEIDGRITDLSGRTRIRATSTP